MKKLSVQPGFLVQLTTQVKGGVKYEKVDLGEEQDGESKIRKWQTTCITADAEEHALANKIRSDARGMIVKVCNITPVGLICPKDKEAKLEEALDGARSMIKKFNLKAECCKVHLDEIVVEFEENNEKVLQSISNSIHNLLEDMQMGVNAIDAKAIRDAADKATALGKMLDGEKAEKAHAAVKAARSAARKITKILKEGADEAAKAAALAAAKAQAGPIETARFAFMEDAPEQVEIPDLPADQLERFDLTDDDIPEQPEALPVPDIDIPPVFDDVDDLSDQQVADVAAAMAAGVFVPPENEE